MNAAKLKNHVHMKQNRNCYNEEKHFVISVQYNTLTHDARTNTKQDCFPIVVA